MTEEEISDFRRWEIEMFDHVNRRLRIDSTRRHHPSYESTYEELREIIEATEAFPPTRWW